jgi:uncharacterized short protein YbdD (DUF466 family)
MPRSEAIRRLWSALREARRGWRRIVGAPDYEVYLEHHAAAHPDQAPMTERQYVHWFLEQRYNRPGAKSCC